MHYASLIELHFAVREILIIFFSIDASAMTISIALSIKHQS
jgi:hypothetical protein